MIKLFYEKTKNILYHLSQSKNQFKLKCWLFLLSFSEAIIFPIPPDSLLILLVLTRRDLAFAYARICSLGSIIGGIVGYLIGWLLWDVVKIWFFAYTSEHTIHLFGQMRELYQQYDFWIIFTAGFTPIPYKLFTLSAGLFNISFWMFLCASFISRSARFFLVSLLIYHFGPIIQNTIERHFNKISIIVTLVLIGLYILYNR